MPTYSAIILSQSECLGIPIRRGIESLSIPIIGFKYAKRQPVQKVESYYPESGLKWGNNLLLLNTCSIPSPYLRRFILGFRNEIRTCSGAGTAMVRRRYGDGAKVVR